MYVGTMTIEQALEAMKQGHKVANSYFSHNEYLTCEVTKGQYIDGHGCLQHDEIVRVYDEGGNYFNDWFFGEGAYNGKFTTFKNDGLCWRIVE